MRRLCEVAAAATTRLISTDARQLLPVQCCWWCIESTFKCCVNVLLCGCTLMCCCCRCWSNLQAQETNAGGDADSLQDSFVVMQQSCEELSAAAAGLQELRLTVQQLEQDAIEVAQLQQRMQELAGVPQQLVQLRQEVDELQQMAEEQQAMQVRLCQLSRALSSRLFDSCTSSSEFQLGSCIKGIQLVAHCLENSSSSVSCCCQGAVCQKRPAGKRALHCSCNDLFQVASQQC